jgi:hypothetical protein
MASETLALLQAALLRRGVSPKSISIAAEELCMAIDHEIALWRHDRNRYDTRIKSLESEVHRLMTKGQAE